MAPTCSICGRADRVSIDADIAVGAGSLATIAARYGVSKSALIRHRDNHGSAPLRPNATIAEPGIDRCEAARAATALDDTETIHGPCETVEPSIARLREVASLLARGLSRAEIALRYGVHVDTVTAWHRHIREKGILRVKKITAAEIVANLLRNQAQRSHALWGIFHEAKAKGLPRVAVTALDGLRKEDRHVFEIAEGIGAFDQFKLVPEEPAERPPEAEVADFFRNEIVDLLDALKFAGEEDHLGQDDPGEFRARLEGNVSAETPDDAEQIF